MNFSNVIYEQPSSATINYLIINNPSSSTTTVYLYRFTGLSAPATLTTTGDYSSAINLLSLPVYANYNPVSIASYTDNTLSPSTNYTYAFYNGNTVGSSTILQDSSTNLLNMSITLNTFYDIVLSLSTTNTTNTSTIVNYSITNDLSTSETAYLY